MSAAAGGQAYKLILEYDGSGYHGWQRQKGVVTIQEVVETCLSVLTQEPVRVRAAGRTDAGVHAYGQVASFKTGRNIRPENLLQGLNSLLPADIVARAIEPVDADFHPRFHARSKLYEYRIHNSPLGIAIGRQYAWHIKKPLQWELMRECLQLLEGTHDFASFQSAGSKVNSTVRTIMSTAIHRCGQDLWAMRIEADGFLRHMVRTIVGTVVEVGRGARSVAEFRQILLARDRRQAGMTAPARGLFLLEVRY